MLHSNNFFICTILFTTLSYHLTLYPQSFSQCHSLVIPRSLAQIEKNPELFLERNSKKPHLLWQKKIKKPFSELILSWNASRPKKGHFSFWVNVKYHNWSGWKKLATWGAKEQKTFSNTKNRYVHVKHVRVEMQRKKTGRAYQVKVIAHDGADLRRVKALFVNASNWSDFKEKKSIRALDSIRIKDIPKQSQWLLKHKRTKDLCSPTSISMVSRYFITKKNVPTHFETLSTQTVQLANKAHDPSLDIFGNWLFNVAQAFNITRGNVLYRVERLNTFEALYKHLTKNVPIAVSIRGNLRGTPRIKKSKCAWPYNNGHFIVVIGWNKENQTVTCIDPAFRQENLIERNYRLRDFVQAWGRSRNLSYVPIPIL